MDENGGLSSEEKQRQTASEIARRRVLTAYENAGKLKDEKINVNAPKISNEEWKRYHSAWQNYYQKYYSEYYSNAAKTYVATEKMKAERELAEKNAALEEISKKPTNSSSYLREKIRKKASDSALNAKRRKKLLPIFAGLAVIFVILFLQYNRLIFAPIAAYISPGNSPTTEAIAIDPTVSVSVSSDPKLIIPKLNVDVPVSFGIPLSEVDNAMQNGVAHYRISGASAFPGEIGNTVITGHSAGDIYSNNQYKFIFSGLERLVADDLIYVNYNSTRYTYRVTKTDVIEPTNVAALQGTSDKPMLILITCTPLGTSRYRLLIFAEQISPSYNGSPSAAPATIEEKHENNLPSNEPSIFERLWKWLTGNN